MSVPEGTWGAYRCGLGAERGLEASTGLRPRLWQPGLRLWDRAGDAAPAACGLPGRQSHGGDASSLTDPRGLQPRVWGLPDLLTARWCSSASKATPRGLSRGLTTEGRGPAGVQAGAESRHPGLARSSSPRTASDSLRAAAEPDPFPLREPAVPGSQGLPTSHPQLPSSPVGGKTTPTSTTELQQGRKDRGQPSAVEGTWGAPV